MKMIQFESVGSLNSGGRRTEKRYIAVSATICLALLATTTRAQAPTTPKSEPSQQQTKPLQDVLKNTQPPPTKDVTPVPRILPYCPVRLGGVYLSGLGKPARNNSPAPSKKLSPENLNWIGRNLDMIAVKHTDIEVDTFTSIMKINHLFTPLLYVYASTLFEKERGGSVGGWRPEMTTWTLKNSAGKEIPHPEAGAHWMDCVNPQWTGHWTSRVNQLAQRYGANGIVAAEPPLSAPVEPYSRDVNKASKTTLDWLESVKSGRKVMLLPSSVGFELVSTLPRRKLSPDEKPEVPEDLLEAELEGRLWNAYFSRTEGAWAEGWLRPYWEDRTVSERVWEMQVEAADRASYSLQPLIVAAGYRNADDLEFALASYLLIAKKQGRVVFQPMPIDPKGKPDAGLDLAVLQREVKKYDKLFHVTLGSGIQQRHQIPVQGGLIWHRRFELGEVYVNSNETKTLTLTFGGEMKRVSGALVQEIVLEPQSGVILTYP